jgi:hypothetical protein
VQSLWLTIAGKLGQMITCGRCLGTQLVIVELAQCLLDHVYNATINGKHAAAGAHHYVAPHALHIKHPTIYVQVLLVLDSQTDQTQTVCTQHC